MKKLLFILALFTSFTCNAQSIGFSCGETYEKASTASMFIIVKSVYINISDCSTHGDILHDLNYEVGYNLKLNDRISILPIMGVSSEYDTKYHFNKPIYGCGLNIDCVHINLIPKVTNYNLEIGIALKL